MTVRIKHKDISHYKLRSTPKLIAFEVGVANHIAGRANAALKGKGGKGFAVRSRQGAKRPQGRWRVTVAAISPYARHANAKYNLLLRALSG